MFDLSSIILKIDDLKAKVENDSITPTCLGSLLDVIVAAIRDIDMTDYKQTIVSSKNDAEKALDDAAKATNIASAAQDKAIANAGNIATLAANLEKLKQTVNTLYGQNATDAIESFNEVIDFLAGLKDDESLALLLSDINTRILAVNTTLKQLAASIAAEEDQRNDADEILNAKVSKALIASDRFVRFDGILDQEHDAEFVPPGVYFFNDQKRFGRTNGRDVDFGAFDGYELFDEPDLHVYYDNVFKLYHYDGNVLNPYVVSVAGKGLSANDYTDADKAKLTALPTNEQFGYVGHYDMDGRYWNETSYANSGLIPVNRNFNIKYAANVGGYVASVVFFDGAKTFISAIQVPQTLSTQILPAADIPQNAVFFVVSTASPAASHYQNGPTLESREGAMAEAIQAAKLALFIDEFRNAVGGYGDYNPKNAPDANHPFYLNTLWLTYEEALTVWQYSFYPFGTTTMDFLCTRGRTNIPRASSARYYVNSFGQCEVVNFAGMPATGLNVCFSSDMATTIINLNLMHATYTIDLSNLTRLEKLEITHLRKSLRLDKASLLSLASLQYIISNADNTEAITVTVHPTVYGKLTDEQADIMALLPENLLGDVLNHSGGVTVIDGGIEITAARQYVRFNHSPHLVDQGLGKLTIACDVEGLGDGELIKLAVGGANDVQRPKWIISANGRAVFSFDTSAYYNDSTSSNSFLLYDDLGSFNGQSVKLTNFKLSYGEHDALPYTAPLSSITDDATREKAEWLSLMQIAEARQINFVTTE